MKKIKEEVELDEAGYVKGKDPLPAGKELADIMKKRRKDRKGKKDKKEEVELEEDIMPLIFGGGIIAGLLPVLYLSAKEIAGPSIGKLVDKLKKNKNYKMSDSEKSDVKGFVSKVKKRNQVFYKKQ